MIHRVFVGYDPREELAYKVCKHSLEKHCQNVIVQPIKEGAVRRLSRFNRPFEKPDKGFRVDCRDGRPYSTEFAFTRFLTPGLGLYEGWALFIDCDFLFRADVSELFGLADDRYAVMCVHHDFHPEETVKMDGCVQTSYERKNWSSCVLFNCAHPANEALTTYAVNSQPGNWLHRFSWLEDGEIGEIPEAWNWLEGHSSPEIDPRAVHFTRGGPWFKDYQDVSYAEEWIAEAKEVEPDWTP